MQLAYRVLKLSALQRCQLVIFTPCVIKTIYPRIDLQYI